MISKVYENIAAGLKAVRDCSIYQEKRPQNPENPSFLISINNRKFSKGINGRLKNSISLDIMYFPENMVQAREECWQMTQEMNRGFYIKDFKIKKRDITIEDDVLHYKFEVDCRECVSESDPDMQSIIHRERIKED